MWEWRPLDSQNHLPCRIEQHPRFHLTPTDFIEVDETLWTAHSGCRPVAEKPGCCYRRQNQDPRAVGDGDPRFVSKGDTCGGAPHPKPSHGLDDRSEGLVRRDVTQHGWHRVSRNECGAHVGNEHEHHGERRGRLDASRAGRRQPPTTTARARRTRSWQLLLPSRAVTPSDANRVRGPPRSPTRWPSGFGRDWPRCARPGAPNRARASNGSGR